MKIPDWAREAAKTIEGIFSEQLENCVGMTKEQRMLWMSSTIAGLAEKDFELGQKAMKTLHDLTAGGSEFYNDPERCAKFIRDSRESQHRMILRLTFEKNGLLSRAWTKGKDGWSVEASDLQENLLQRCPECLDLLSKGTITAKMNSENEVQWWEVQHECGQKLIIFND